MLEKKLRLREREVKKVLAKGKPFFSYKLAVRHIPNTLPYPRFAIIISGKSAPNAVVRNIYRRAYYQSIAQCGVKLSGDIVCIIPKKTKISRDPEVLKELR